MTSWGSETLIDLIARRTGETPDRIAVTGADDELTYRQLDLIATRLATRLAARGAGPESVIGLCAGRTPKMIAAAMGIMLSGAAYIFLDPAYPPERISFMLADSGVELIVAEPAVGRYLPHEYTTVDIEANDKAGASDFAMRSPVPGNLACLIYTSGSTGKPKGVGIEHRSIMELIGWGRSYFGIDAFRSVLASTSMSFDMSVFEIFAPLSCGGAVHVMRDLLELAETDQAPRLSLITTVPSVLTELVRLSGLPRGIPNIGLAGETLPRQLVHQLYREYDAGQVYNLYGPTETTVYSTAYAVPPDEDGPVPIGKPIAGDRVEIIQTPGAPAREGELNIIGAGVARGYIGRPMLTAERFIPATEGLPGERAYRTGDLVRLREDGNLEFIDRSDDQVKIHGVRIELGEIETVLGTHPSIAQVKAAVRESPLTGLPRLLAYATLRPGAGSVDLTTLREHAATLLPEQMLPSELILLERLPLLPNGKLDRSALPSPAGADPAGADPAGADPAGANPPDGSRAAVPTASATHVLAIWSRLLDRQNIGLDDDFFAIGGDSLTATRAIWELRASLKAEIPLRTIYEHRTVRALSEWLTVSLLPSRRKEDNAGKRRQDQVRRCCQR